MDKRIDLLLGTLAQQRNQALDQLAIAQTDLTIAQDRVKKLEEEVAKLAPPQPAEESHD